MTSKLPIFIISTIVFCQGGHGEHSFTEGSAQFVERSRAKIRIQIDDPKLSSDWLAILMSLESAILPLSGWF